MLLLRDCWKAVVSEDNWNIFASLEGTNWLKWNLNHEVGKGYTKKVPWLILFGYLCWDIWVARCNKLFGGTSQDDDQLSLSSFFRANADQDLLGMRVLANIGRLHQGTRPQELQSYFSLEVYGSVFRDERSGCVGVIRDLNNQYICGFTCKLIAIPPVIAELIGMIHGLYLCWSKGYQKICIFSNCIEAINLAVRGCDVDYPFKDLVDKIRSLIYRDWQLRFVNVPRENLTLADSLAKLAHSILGNFCIFDHLSPLEQEVER